MHQEHNVPWNALASNFKFVRENPHFTPRTTGLFPRQLPTQAATLNHFTRVLHTTITTFSTTERQKYPASFPAPTSGLLFSDELRDRHTEFLNEKNQSIDFWIESAKHGYTPGKLVYTTANAGLADAVKVLVSENEMEPIFMLARHPQIPLGTLKFLCWGQNYGFSCIRESALHAYVELNLWAAMGLLERGEYLEMNDYKCMLYNALAGLENGRHQIPHRAYFDALPKDEGTGQPIVHRDFAGLKKYLKTNFRLLYRYDMLMKECGLDAEWETEIANLFAYDIGIGTKLEYVEVDGSRARRFA
ncbi:hypothetical protein DXG01_009995 [Tephrocybe rancida]|nr:hypothetical protein DXG01_009995 [Tephrocybe rancida]